MDMANALQHVAWEPCLLEPRQDRTLEAYARRKQGMPHPSVHYFTSVPWMARALVDLHPEFGLLMHLDQAVADLVVLVVSQENSCRFCYAAVRAMLWAQGMCSGAHPARWRRTWRGRISRRGRWPLSPSGGASLAPARRSPRRPGGASPCRPRRRRDEGDRVRGGRHGLQQPCADDSRDPRTPDGATCPISFTCGCCRPLLGRLIGATAPAGGQRRWVRCCRIRTPTS